MNYAERKPFKEKSPAEKPLEQDPNFVKAKQIFESRIKPGIDIYLPKLAAFTKHILQLIELSGKTAVFIGRYGRWLYYLAKII